MTLSIGQLLHNNRYQIDEMIGRGGFGAVYRATDIALQQTVAIKENLNTSVESERQFQREATILARLRHAHLPRVSDHFIIHGQGQYLVMDFIEGKSLAEMLKERGRPFSEQELLPWVHQVCDALTYLHTRPQPIIHRDVKPSNIIITPDGDAMVVDFGIAKLYDTSQTTTVGAQGITPGYSPPEQYGGGGTTDASSDVYALGATLYALLTGQQPPDSVHRLARLAELMPPRQVNPLINPVWERVILQAMDPDKSRRLANASTLKTALVPPPSLEATVVEPRLPASHQRLPRQRASWVGAVGGLLLLGVAIWAAILLRDRNELAIPPPTPEALPMALLSALTETPTQIATPLSPATLRLTNTPRVTLTPSTSPVATQVETPVSSPTIATTSTPQRASLLQNTMVIAPVNVGQLQELARFGKGTINQIVCSPDGQLLAIASSLGIYLYDITNLEERRFIDTGSGVEYIAFAPDGQALATGDEDGAVKLWNVADGHLLQIFEEATSQANPVGGVAFSPDGQIVASLVSFSGVRLWNTDSGQLLRTLDAGPYGDIVFSPDGESIAFQSRGGIQLWNVNDGQLLQTLERDTGYSAESLVFTPEGEILAVSSYDGSYDIIEFWDTVSGHLLETRTLEEYRIRQIAFSPDGEMLASGAYDGTVLLWDAVTGQLLHTLEGHTDAVINVNFFSDGEILASASRSDVRLWNVADGHLLRTLTLEGYTEWDLGGISFSASGEMLAFRSNNGVSLWNVAEEQFLQTISTRGVSSFAFSPVEEVFASSVQGVVQLWNPIDGQLLQILESNTELDSFVFSSDGETLATGSGDGTVLLWNVVDGQLLQTLHLQGYEGGSMAFSADGTTLTSVGNVIRLWNSSDGRLLQALDTGQRGVLALSPDGTMASSGIELWHVPNRLLLRYLTYEHQSDRDGVSSAAFSPDGEMLATGSSAGLIRLWDVADGRLLHTFDTHADWITNIAFSPDGKLLASWSHGDVVRVWGVVER